MALVCQFFDLNSLSASNLSVRELYLMQDSHLHYQPIDGSALTGVASTDNIRTNTNATFLTEC